MRNQAGEHEGQHQARPGILGSQARHHEDARADDGAYAQGGQGKGTQSPRRLLAFCSFASAIRPSMGSSKRDVA